MDGEKWTQADVNALQKENDKLREEIEILKRA
ncbi:transposase, partial [Leuconostoc mesenteroides subsp. cremoris]